MPTQTEIAQAARIMREATKDKSYQLCPLGQSAAGYLRVKRKRLTESSHRDYERGLDKLARYFPDLDVPDFEPPIGTQRVEEFLDVQYGAGSPRNYNKNLSILRDFFKYLVLRGELHGDPTLAVERARARGVYRTTFTPEQRRAIIAAAEERRDRIALRLLFDYALRKGTLRAVQFKHFDHQRRRLTTFAKGGKVRELPIPDPHFWMDLERLILDWEAKPSHYLMASTKTIPVGVPEGGKRGGARRMEQRRFPDRALSDHGMHNWWYRCLAAAGVTEPGQTNGERMHKARHTAGQRLLDHTGNLKAVQKLLDHSTIQTTADIYTDWDVEQLTASLESMLDHEPT